MGCVLRVSFYSIWLAQGCTGAGMELKKARRQAVSAGP